MDGNSGKPENTGSYIWLRYATQFSVGERTHTIEMGIPVPIGASEALREQLLREAEVGIEQLANHVENRVAKITQAVQLPPTSARSQPVAGTQGTLGTSATRNHTSPPVAPGTPSPKPTILTVSQATPTAPSQPVSTQRATTTPPATAPAPVSHAETVSTAFPMPTTTTSSREAVQSAVPSAKEVEVPATRHHIGASMPSAPGMSGDAGGSMKLPQFIQYIKEALGLTPKQAMDLLNVKTLSGLNLRDALEQLQTLVVRDVAATPTIQTPVVRDTNTAKPEVKTPPVHAAPAPTPTPPRSTASSIPTPSGVKEITNAVVRDMPPPYAAFDEEIDIDGVEDELDLGGDEGVEFLPELTDQEREIAEEVLKKLKEARGSSAASEARLRVLNNVVNGQVSDEQLLQITDGVWGINAIKKLKSDQVEALISWAKEDEFINEAEIVIMLIQEGQYARSDR